MEEMEKLADCLRTQLDASSVASFARLSRALQADVVETVELKILATHISSDVIGSMLGERSRCFGWALGCSALDSLLFLPAEVVDDM